jgi:hypothetical protein
MITVIICAIIAFCISFYRFNLEGFCELIDKILLSVMISVAGALFGSLIAILIPVEKQTDHWAVKLESLQDKSTINGSFFLGCGRVGEEMRYMFYAQEPDSTYKLYQVPYINASIKYSGNQPSEHVYYTHPVKSKWRRFGLSDEKGEYKYIFEVPKGSIKNDYTLDAL